MTKTIVKSDHIIEVHEKYLNSAQMHGLSLKIWLQTDQLIHKEENKKQRDKSVSLVSNSFSWDKPYVTFFTSHQC